MMSEMRTDSRSPQPVSLTWLELGSAVAVACLAGQELLLSYRSSPDIFARSGWLLIAAKVIGPLVLPYLAIIVARSSRGVQFGMAYGVALTVRVAIVLLAVVPAMALLAFALPWPIGAPLLLVGGPLLPVAEQFTVAKTTNGMGVTILLFVLQHLTARISNRHRFLTSATPRTERWLWGGGVLAGAVVVILGVGGTMPSFREMTVLVANDAVRRANALLPSPESVAAALAAEGPPMSLATAGGLFEGEALQRVGDSLQLQLWRSPANPARLNPTLTVLAESNGNVRAVIYEIERPVPQDDEAVMPP